MDLKMVTSDNNRKVVYIAHAIDTEGPLYESLEAKFERIKELFRIEHIEETKSNFQKLQNGEIPLEGQERNIQEVINGHRVSYNDTWDKIDNMMHRLMRPEFRMKYPDSARNGWVFSWHCMDHVGYDYNPRRRDIGYHNVFDYYRQWVDSRQSRDDLQWHFHPMSTYRDAHRCATSYFQNDLIFQILSRKIIERNWFPSAYRAGFQTERPDSHWFLEQWIPFDITNMAVDDLTEFDKTIDFKNGRSGNWRRAPSDWSIYQPDHDDYQRPGRCRRWIGRALNVMNRLCNINQAEVDKAFARAQAEDGPVLMGLTGHDWRNLETEVDHARELINEASKKYPDVRFEYCTVADAFRRTIWSDGVQGDALELEIELIPESDEDVTNILVRTKQGEVFGPQPFLAIETMSRRFIHDNFDFTQQDGVWAYAFHTDTLPFDDVRRLSVAANDKYGNTSIVHLDIPKTR